MLYLSCVCGKPFCVEHAFTCPCGGFPSIRHNEVRDLTASLLSEVCSDVGVLSLLSSLFSSLLIVSHCNSLLPIVKVVPVLMLLPCRDFWGRNRQRAFFDVRVFNPLRALIFAPNCPDVTSFMNVKKDGHTIMMSVLERLRGLAFHHWCLQLLVAWGPLLQQFLGSLLQCWLRSAALNTANAYSGCDVGFVFHC